MKLIKVFVVMMAVTLVACNPASKEPKEGWEITLKGKIKFPQDGNIILTEIRQDEAKPLEDSIKANADGTFEKKINLKEPGYFRLSFYGQEFVNLILDKSDVEVNVAGNDPSEVPEIKGSPDMDLIMGVQKIMVETQSSAEMQALETEFRAAGEANDMKKVEELREKYQTTLKVMYDKIAAFLASAPPSLGLINILQNNNPLDKDEYFSLYVDAAEKVKKDWSNNYYGKMFIASVETMKKTAIGQPAPEISMPTPEGDTLKLSSFRGKYVLVDFWAKWCGPCRAENPNVVNAYHMFKGKGFDILGVSLDRTKEDWVAAIKQDGLVWHHVSDLKYYNNQAALDYNVSGIPFSILVDPNGIIVAKNTDLRGPMLQKTLSTFLNKKG